MFKKTAMGAVAAAAITMTALAGTATSAQAHHIGGWYGPGIVIGGPGFHFGYYGNPCRHWKRKFNRTGRWKYWRRYKRCLRRHW